jgi:hypothetical protein
MRLEPATFRRDHARALLALVAACGACVPVWSQNSPASTTPAAADEGNRAFRWSGSQRARYSRLLNQFRPGFSGDDQAMVLRTELRAELVLPRFDVVGELQDVRAYLTDEQSAVSTGLVNTFGVIQAYVSIEAGAAGKRPELKLGRFVLELGSGRLVAGEQYRDVARNHTGGLAHWALGEQSELWVFAVLPVIVAPADRASLLDNDFEHDHQTTDLEFAGTMYKRQELPFDGTGEAYVYFLEERDDPGELETRDRDLTAAGFRFFRNPAAGRWDFETENIWQSGHARATTNPADLRNLDVDAHFHHLQIGYSLERTWSPRVTVEYEYASGDADPADGRWQRFDPLFANRRIDLGPTNIYNALGRENIDTLGVRLSIAPNPRADAFAIYRIVRLAEARDVFATTGIQDASGAAGRDGGRQLDIRFRRRFREGVIRLDAGASFLWEGKFMQNAPNATGEGDSTFFYCDVTYTFGPSR